METVLVEKPLSLATSRIVTIEPFISILRIWLEIALLLADTAAESESSVRARARLVFRRLSVDFRTAAAWAHQAISAGYLTLWKDADPDIPILKQAKAEYAKLQ